MLFLGVDPGKSGAIAAVGPTGLVHATCRLKETPADVWAWLDGLKDDYEPQPVFGLIEKVGSMPRQGVSSTFKFGYSAGMCEAFIVAAGIPHELITPVKWQNRMKCRSGGDKNVTKQAAQRLWPGERVIHATADAMLLAECARRIYNERRGE